MWLTVYLAIGLLLQCISMTQCGHVESIDKLSMILPFQDTSFKLDFSLKRIERQLGVTMLRLLGEGNFGKVYLVTPSSDIPFHPHYKQLMALKLMDLTDDEAFVMDDQYIFTSMELYETELAAMKAFQHVGAGYTTQLIHHETLQHPTTETDDDGLLLMDYVYGVSLNDFVYGANFKDMLWCGIRLLRAVQFLHARGYSHNDLQINNIFLTYSMGHVQQVILGDLGFTGLSPSVFGTLEDDAKAVYSLLGEDLLGYYLEQDHQNIPFWDTLSDYFFIQDASHYQHVLVGSHPHSIQNMLIVLEYHAQLMNMDVYAPLALTPFTAAVHCRTSVSHPLPTHGTVNDYRFNRAHLILSSPLCFQDAHRIFLLSSVSPYEFIQPSESGSTPLRLAEDRYPKVFEWMLERLSSHQ